MNEKHFAHCRSCRLIKIFVLCRSNIYQSMENVYLDQEINLETWVALIKKWLYLEHNICITFGPTFNFDSQSKIISIVKIKTGTTD